MTNPTGKGIRNDRAGGGFFGAPRRKHTDGGLIVYRHQGVDLLCNIGQEITAPCTGRMSRVVSPYRHGQFRGVEIQAKRATIKLMYLEPNYKLLGKIVRQGQVIGIAQDITEKYPDSGMLPHIHIEVTNYDPTLLLEGLDGSVN